eukprot:scaffold25258_cov184-Skeletonema_dohrnii-CCMP3373.AAC.2
MHCREKTSFNPAEPKYHRLLIDLLSRAQKYAAAQVKNEEQTEVEENETTDVTPVKEEQNDAFEEGRAASEAKVDREGVDADDDRSGSVKREGDTNDHLEQETKRPKSMTPSSPLVRVEGEPTEFDDYDETTSLERRAPINGIDTSTTNTDYTPASPKVEDEEHRFMIEVAATENAGKEASAIQKMKDAFEQYITKLEASGGSIEKEMTKQTDLLYVVTSISKHDDPYSPYLHGIYTTCQKAQEAARKTFEKLSESYRDGDFVSHETRVAKCDMTNFLIPGIEGAFRPLFEVLGTPEYELDQIYTAIAINAARIGNDIQQSIPFMNYLLG